MNPESMSMTPRRAFRAAKSLVYRRKLLESTHILEDALCRFMYSENLKECQLGRYRVYLTDTGVIIEVLPVDDRIKQMEFEWERQKQMEGS